MEGPTDPLRQLDARVECMTLEACAFWANLLLIPTSDVFLVTIARRCVPQKLLVSC